MLFGSLFWNRFRFQNRIWRFSKHKVRASNTIRKSNGYIDSLLFNFPAEIRCLKHKIELKRCIASSQKYEHVNEHSSIVPIKFRLSVKKTHYFKMNNRNILKNYAKQRSGINKHGISHWEIANDKTY